MQKLFGKFSVGKKFKVLFFAIAIAVVVAAGIYFVLFTNAQNILNNFFSGPLEAVQAQASIIDEVNTMDTLALEMAGSSARASDYKAQLAEADKSLSAKFDVITKTSTDAEKAGQLPTLYAVLQKDFEKMYQLSSTGNTEEAVAYANAQYTTDYDSFYGAVSAALKADLAAADTTQHTYSAKTTAAMTLFAILALIALVVTTVFMKAMSDGIVGPLNQIVGACDTLARGETIEPLHIDSQDEFQTLANSFNQMSDTTAFIVQDVSCMLSSGAEKDFSAVSQDESRYVGNYARILEATHGIFHGISDDMSRTNGIADQVSAGSNQISAVSQTLSQGTTEQASAVEELSSTVASIADIGRANAEEASKASAMSVEASQGVTESNNYMAQMLEAMNEITSTSREISKIVKAIADIAFQTNILSLNAAVEAARAGASGKGFAVVADEVRNLSQRSAEAAKTTTALVESTVSAIEHGRDIADATAKSLQTVGEKAAFVNDAIAKIAEASKEQATATQQVLVGIDQVSTVVQTNSATAEESAAAAEELAAQARELAGMTHQYKLRAME